MANSISKTQCSESSPPWLRPPAWRWMEIVAEVEGGRSGERADSWVKRGVDFLSDWRANGDERASRSRFPGMLDAMKTFADNRQGGWRWMLEALLTTPESDAKIARLLGDTDSAKIIGAYRKLFYDVDAYRDSPAAMSTNVLACAGARSAAFGASDYVWKMFAYAWGARAFVDAICAGDAEKGLTDKQRRWLEGTIRDELLCRSASAVEELKRGYSESAVALVELTKDQWSKPVKSHSETLLERHLNEILSLQVMNFVRERPESEYDAFEGRSGCSEHRLQLVS